ncbi:MAG: diguanylate cyclase [Campylobacterales bacterium]|nr:diguanylate cyclase [Campylobacterales bacterium]
MPNPEDSTVLPSFATLDVQAALSHLGGSAQLYRSVLRQFYDEYHAFNLDHADEKQRRYAIHTLKGLSGNIGAFELYAITSQIDATADHALLPRLHDALERVCSEIDRLIPPSANPPNETKSALKGAEPLCDLPTVLIVEDAQSNVDILLQLLRPYTLLVAMCGADALAYVGSRKVDLVLLDIMLPDIDGYGVCAEIKSDPQNADLPVIFLTAKTDEASLEKAYDVGGVDYVTKPFRPKELLARVRTHIRLKKTIEHLEYIASHDSMTGLYNRHKFFELALIRFEQPVQPLYAVMLDIDFFKRINDTFGHAAGDEALKAFAHVLHKESPPSALIARLGGEEFVWLDSFANDDEAILAVEAVREATSAIKILTSQGETIRLNVSAGIARYDPARHYGLDTLLLQADRCLYKAKTSGRDRSAFRC